MRKINQISVLQCWVKVAHEAESETGDSDLFAGWWGRKIIN